MQLSTSVPAHHAIAHKVGNKTSAKISAYSVMLQPTCVKLYHVLAYPKVAIKILEKIV